MVVENKNTKKLKDSLKSENNLTGAKRALYIKMRDYILDHDIAPRGLTFNGHWEDLGREEVKIFHFRETGYLMTWTNKRGTLFSHKEAVPLEILIEDLAHFIDMGISDLYASNFMYVFGTHNI